MFCRRGFEERGERWVSDTFEWRPGDRLAQPANRMPDGGAYVAYVRSRGQFELPGKGWGIYGE